MKSVKHRLRCLAVSPMLLLALIEAILNRISLIHSALQTSVVNAVNRFATIRNRLIGRYIVEYEKCGNL